MDLHPCDLEEGGFFSVSAAIASAERLKNPNTIQYLREHADTSLRACCGAILATWCCYTQCEHRFQKLRLPQLDLHRLSGIIDVNQCDRVRRDDCARHNALCEGWQVVGSRHDDNQYRPVRDPILAHLQARRFCLPSWLVFAAGSNVLWCDCQGGFAGEKLAE